MKKEVIKRDEILEIYTDGASRGNPGPAAWSYLFVLNDKVIHQNSGYIGEATNNTAEYHAIINALKEAEKWTRGNVKIYSDSELAIRQLNKVYKIKKKHLSELYNKIYNLRNNFIRLDFYHLKRGNKYIKECDLLCNKCLDAKGF